MAKKQTDFHLDINWKCKVYRNGLEATRHLIADNSFAAAVVKSLETLVLASEGEIPLTNSMEELFAYCHVLVPDLSIFVSPYLPHPELANRLKGILHERKAYYTQLKNLHTSV